MAYTNAYTVAVLPAFLHRLEMALNRYCLGIMGNVNASQQEKDLAKRVLDSAEDYAAKFAKAIASQEAAQVLVDAEQTGANVTDAVLDAQIALAYTAFIR